MRSLLLATAVLALTVGSSLAAEAPKPPADQQQKTDNSSLDAQCPSILADKSAHSEADVKYCESKQQ
jgi:hypothetical protein